MLGLLALVLYFYGVVCLFSPHRKLAWILGIYGVISIAFYLHSFLLNTKGGERLRRRLQYAWKEFAIPIRIVLLIALVLAIPAALVRDENWYYVLQFAVGGWPENFKAMKGSRLLIFAGVFLQGLVVFGIPAALVSIFRTLLKREEIMNLMRFIKHRDREIEVQVTDAVFHNIERIAAKKESDEREEEILKIVQEAIGKAHNAWEDGQTEDTKIDINRAGIRVGREISG